MTGAEYIAEFLAREGCDRVFSLTGGACAFMIDAVARHPKMRLTCFQHEQSSAMAADALWRVSRKVGVTMATSGPGATNLITGIACSYFDSIPSIHITGQVNQRESSAVHGANVRQSGFQETKIVEMVQGITKYAVMVRSTEDLRREFPKALHIALSGRMGPVLIDVPMDIQQLEAEPIFDHMAGQTANDDDVSDAVFSLSQTLTTARRPIVLWGGGVGMAGVQDDVSRWLIDRQIPFVSSWAGLSSFDHDHPCFLGQIGVYGNRGANFALQNADTVLVFGSRLDNRQRSGNPNNFAVGATVHVVDVDEEELKKYGGQYRTTHLDCKNLPQVLAKLPELKSDLDWSIYAREIKEKYFGKEISSSALRLNTLSPYDVVRRINEVIDEDAIVVADTGATVCWVHQAFKVKRHTLFTAGGNSPMGYGVPAAIGAKLESPDRQVVSFNGDGGFQLNLQELQTVKHHDLDVAIVVMNNQSYGIIKQFQDSYLKGVYAGSEDGYSTPDFGKIAGAYGLRYVRVESLDQLTPETFKGGAILVDVMLSPDTLIEPKLEMGRPINDQYPYLNEAEYRAGNRFVEYIRPESLRT